ncbi:hypothetical protein B0H67DRAFT_478833 [Lasiosphaeris hirsuta]|uniref:Uncharacterized protein n=1 Tax=Lasiosphaeris hirsuta TaxID=260670 RepID=A0AA40B9M2_9PEZI|nr:hypothetical protein B0H67DRAFT_478833 [Lasiosphaeris hirsuta]
MAKSLLALSIIAATTFLVHASPPSLLSRGGRGSKRCPPFNNGTFVIDYFQLYPENADWDPDSCLVWIGAVWNGTVALFDPYADKVVEVLEFPGTSHTGSQHIGGVAWDPYSGLITILTDSASPWGTGGADVSGDHLIMKYNHRTKKTLWSLNITELTHEKYGGFQDVETDRRGNTYIVGTFPGTVLKVDKHGTAVTPWYVPDPLPPTTKKGFGGLAAVPGSEILLSNDGDGRIYRFDMRDKTGKPVHVPMRPEKLYTDTDAIYLPPRWGGSVLLVASNFGGIQVLRSKDKLWKTAENLGTIPSPTGGLNEGSVATAVVQVGNDPGLIYLIEGFWDVPWVPGTVAGNRTLFPFPDLTKDIERLLK